MKINTRDISEVYTRLASFLEAERLRLEASRVEEFRDAAGQLQHEVADLERTAALLWDAKVTIDID